jgi:hypothetical protein
MTVLFKVGGAGEAFDNTYDDICRAVMSSPYVNTGHWQSLRDVPQTATREIHNALLEMQTPATSGALASLVKPNLPWAEDHFCERVGGQPLNPGEQYKNWPYYRGNVEQHQTEEEMKFSHTYMERLWPKEAGMPYLDPGIKFSASGFEDHAGRAEHRGIRYAYGDLRDVVGLLVRQPHTRQAYVPLWFPEDTGATHGQRVPCTLGYHFMMRRDRLHCFYPIRSCDVIRHFKDDVYMAGRLVQWMIGQCRDQGGDKIWKYVQPGSLTVFAPSLHIFEGDVPMLERKYGQVGVS